MRPTKLEVNIDNFIYNMNEIKKYTQKEVMPVIKANAYGTYLNKKIDVIDNFKIVAVALVCEGKELRELGYKGEILILNQPSHHEIDEIIKYQLTIGISSKSFLMKCIEKNASFKIHLEIETGMNRTGININGLEEFLDVLDQSKLEICGIYTHFSSADTDDVYSQTQIKQLKKALDICLNRNIKFQYVHMSASNGLLMYDLPFTNLVRPGILLYGYESYKDCSKIIPIKPTCRLISEITLIKTVPAGTKIGYSGKHICKKETTVATIPIGYGDGLRRSYSDEGYVLINQKKAKIIGNICMDSMMVDITDIPSSIGDEVIIFDDKNILLDKIAEKCNTINYEILCTIESRVPRVFIQNKE